MKNVLLVLLLNVFVFSAEVSRPEKIVDCQKVLQNGTAEEIQRSGCCSWHQGACDCSSGGRVICCDGTLSPSCTCRGGGFIREGRVIDNKKTR